MRSNSPGVDFAFTGEVGVGAFCVWGKMPTPQPGQESEQEWISRCMSSDEAMDDFPDEDQRFAFCQSEWDEETAENMKAIHSQITARPERDELMGLEGWRIPATGLRSDVTLHNNLGKMEVPEEEIAESAGRWDMTPVTVGHPSERGAPQSGRREQSVNDRAVGFLTNSRAVDGELKTDVFLPDHRVQEFGLEEQVVDVVRNGRPVDVSTAFSGDFEQQDDHIIGRRLQPDHFAILLDEAGACSVEDGCGLGLNHEGPCEGDPMSENVDTDEVADSVFNRLKEFFTAEEGSEMSDEEREQEQGTEPAAENEQDEVEQETATEEPPEWAENLVSTVKSLNERMDELEDAAEPALNEAQQERNRLTSEIAQNSDFEEDELEEWQLGDLRKMRKSLAGSSPGRPGPKAHNTEDGTPDFMPPTNAFAENSEGEE